MAKGVMVNFRLREEDLVRVDSAAQIVGVSRSDFVRDCVSERVAEIVGGGDVKALTGRGKAKEKPVTLDANCPKNPYCLFVKDSAGARVCGTCGFRK